MGAALLAALQAIPALVQAIGQLGDSIKKAQEMAIDNKFEKLKAEVNELTKQIEGATTNEERLKLVRSLNRMGA
jgi:5'-deoxynucleotidase YfbR-like HD superfamily hydrolase